MKCSAFDVKIVFYYYNTLDNVFYKYLNTFIQIMDDMCPIPRPPYTRMSKSANFCVVNLNTQYKQEIHFRPLCMWRIRNRIYVTLTMHLYLYFSNKIMFKSVSFFLC